jgi:hypothetical protein
MTKRKTTEEAEAKAELIYWATGRTKFVPKKISQKITLR